MADETGASEPCSPNAAVKIADYRIGDRLEGLNVYQGYDEKSGEQVVIKLEPLDAERPSLYYGTRVLKLLQDPNGYGVPTLKWQGNTGNYYVSVVERLGSDLDSLFAFCGERLSLKTVLLLADRMLQLAQFVHKKGWIYRDFRPANFLMGQRNKKHYLYVINFQLAKRHSDRQTGIHIPYCEGKATVGTARYASINCQKGIEMSRRDDLESIGYVLMHFLRGKLPWQGLRAQTPELRNARILSRKEATAPTLLCANYPDFQPYFDHVFSLGFTEEPDYNMLRGIFWKIYVNAGYAQVEDNVQFDWDILRGNSDDPRIVDW